MSNAAMRRRVVFPAPLCPSRATNWPGMISSEMPRSATSEPNLFSTLSKRTPQDPKGEAECVPLADKAWRSAFYQIAEKLLHARMLSAVVFFGNSAGLAPQFELEQAFFELVQAAVNLVIHFGNRVSGL